MSSNLNLQSVYLFLVIFLAILFAGTFDAAAPINTLGWWGWYDQGEYLKQTDFIVAEGLVATVEKGFVYPPGYSLLSAIIYDTSQFLGVNLTTGHSIILLNALLNALALWLLIGCLPVDKRISFLMLASIIFVLFYDVRSSLTVPWSSSMSFLGFASFTAILNRFVKADSFNLKHFSVYIVLLSLVLSFLLHTRPQDAVIIATSFGVGSFFVVDRVSIFDLLKVALLTLICIIILELCWFIAADGLAYGNLYTESPHAFFLNGAQNKLLGMLTGSEVYGVFHVSAADRSSSLAFLLAISFFAALILGNVPVKIYALSWCILYGAFSDLGPHNFILYLLIHYYKTLLFAGLFVLVSSDKKVQKLMVVLISAVIVFWNLSFDYEVTDKNIVFADNTVIIQTDKHDINKGDIYYLAFLTEEQSLVSIHQETFFEPFPVKVNGITLKPFKEYRLFTGENGMYIHFFANLSDVEKLEFDMKAKVKAALISNFYQVE